MNTFSLGVGYLFPDTGYSLCIERNEQDLKRKKIFQVMRQFLLLSPNIRVQPKIHGDFLCKNRSCLSCEFPNTMTKESEKNEINIDNYR